MRITFCLAILTLSFALLGSCNVALAEVKDSTTSAENLIKTVENPGAIDLGQSLIHPASPLYFLKAIRERIEMFLDSSREAKSMRQVEFAQRRLREVASLVRVKRQDLIPPALEQYKLHLKSADQAAGVDEELKVRIGEAISRHLDTLQRVYDMVGNPSAKAAIRSAIERGGEQNAAVLQDLGIESQQKLIRKVAGRQAFACKFLLREATSSGLNDSEKESLRQRVRNCTQDVLLNLKDELEELRAKSLSSTPSATGR